MKRARDPLVDFEPGEELLAAARASFRGATATSVRATFSIGPGRMRKRAFDAWHEAAVDSGFPIVPPDMVIAATNRRLLFGRPTFWGRPPEKYSGAVDLGEISQIVAVRHGLVTGVAVAFTHGAIVEIEALRGRPLRQVVQIVNNSIARR